MHRFVLLAALFFAWLPALSAAAPLDAPAPLPAPTQLPRGVRPLHYDVAVVPDAGALRFAGRVAVTIEVSAPTTSLTLNAIDLAFDAVRLSRVGSRREVAPVRIDLDAEAQTATFTFARAIPAGRHRLAMRYRGLIGKQARGLFAIDYDLPSRPQRALFTQFENSDARRMIPSWDEPAYKASFAFEATVPAAQTVVSNMPARASTNAGHGLRRVRFATTPTMSTYLLFFAAGDFERTTMKAGATEIGVVTRPGVAAQAQFALQSTRDILREYDDYFGVPYPLPKLDNVASPGRSQFFGAMENWGAIFSFERTILIDPSLSTQSDREGAFEVAAHEIAHQWFGNLVTMRWWDDLWLNEGFATWMERRTTARLHPEWDTALGAVASRSRAMASDAFLATHAIVQPIVTVEQANQVFDAITYSKSAAVIGMLESYVGADVWRDGVRRYLRAHAYGNTASDDLWRAIDAVSDRPVGAIAHDFTRQPGVPLLRVVASRCENGRTTLELEQGEFSLDRPDKAPLRWQIPVIARIAGHAPARTVVSTGSGRLELDGCGAVIANAGQAGYYRTAYAPQQQPALRAAFAGLAPIDQLGVLDDAWALGLAGMAPLADALELVARVPDNADATVWIGVVEHLRSLDDLYRADPARRTAWRRFAIG
ncbi:MAG: M1 family metallopeptidase, partial [Caldimonas sp.]